MTTKDTTPLSTVDDKDLDEILDEYENGQNPHQSEEYRLDKAKQAIIQWADTRAKAQQAQRIKDNKSFCGCPMCTFHSEAYEGGAR